MLQLRTYVIKNIPKIILSVPLPPVASGVAAPEEESDYRIMFNWFKYHLIMAMNELFHGEHRARWVTISNDEYESMKSTIEVLSDNELLKQIQESREDYRRGRFKKLSELIDS